MLLAKTWHLASICYLRHTSRSFHYWQLAPRWGQLQHLWQTRLHHLFQSLCGTGICECTDPPCYARTSGQHPGASTIGSQLLDGDHSSTYRKECQQPLWQKLQHLWQTHQRFGWDFSTYSRYPGASTIASQLLDGDHSNSYDKDCSTYGKDSIAYGKDSSTSAKSQSLIAKAITYMYGKDSIAYGEHSNNF